MKVYCEECRFFEPDDEDDTIGQCRRRSPIIGPNGEDGAYPVVWCEGWCGEADAKDDTVSPIATS